MFVRCNLFAVVYIYVNFELCDHVHMQDLIIWGVAATGPDHRGKPKDTGGQTESLICAKSKELAVWRCMRWHLPILPG